MLPSQIKMNSYRGYRHNVPDGWKKLEDATIIADDYTVEFYRLSERTIDWMCDALNAYYSVWTKFLCEYSDRQGTLSITVRKPEDADKLYKMLVDIEPIVFEHEGNISAVDVARTKMQTLINCIMNKKGEAHNGLSC